MIIIYEKYHYGFEQIWKCKNKKHFVSIISKDQQAPDFNGNFEAALEWNGRDLQSYCIYNSVIEALGDLISNKASYHVISDIISEFKPANFFSLFEFKKNEILSCTSYIDKNGVRNNVLEACAKYESNFGSWIKVFFSVTSECEDFTYTDEKIEYDYVDSDYARYDTFHEKRLDWISKALADDKLKLAFENLKNFKL